LENIVLRNSLTYRLLFVLVLGVVAVVLFIVWRNPAEQSVEAQITGYGAETFLAEVDQILEEGTITLGDRTQPYQLVSVLIQEGPYQGQRFEVDYGQRQVRPSELRLEPGEQVMVTISRRPEGGVSAYFTDFVRTPSLLWLLLVFVVFSVMISGWKAVRGLLGMALSFAVILGFIIPQILAGKDPVLISVVGSFAVMLLTLYVVYGWTLKTHAAALGTFFALLITGLLANFFMNFTRLTGFGSEDAMFLIQQANFNINLRGLLLGGFLIGALGVLDDLVITQSSVVFELRSAVRELSFRSLYQRAMTVGRDHVAATVNTLVLAYTGVALPMLLLFTLSGQELNTLLNFEFVAEEIVRTLVGSLGLMAAVPLTTLLASWLAIYRDRLGWIGRYLGPEGEGHYHEHLPEGEHGHPD
jgi:uncharacterized membrane protein